MIPKRAIFYWDGEPMSWLRRQSIETFRLLNPTWTVELFDGFDCPIKGDDRLSRVIRSDWFRYAELEKNGGVYFDTDIMFCKPFPDKWLDATVIVPLGTKPNFKVLHIAVLGSEPSSQWFKSLSGACAEIASGGPPWNYQQMGVRLINRMCDSLIREKITWIEPETFLPVQWEFPEQLWTDNYMVPAETIGVHWYGGDWCSIGYEQKADEEWAKSSRCVVAKAWKMAQKASSNVETLMEQHGIA